MPRTFISFLGAIEYKETQYYRQADRRDLSEPMYYVQEALLAAQDHPWGPDDTIWIFTTEEALKKNYVGRVVGPDIVPDEGLKSALERLRQKGRIARFDQVTIPNGFSTEEMWRVFKQVFEKLEPKSELYLDVTYGFRSLPMLATILVNYARTLKEVQVKAIYYGVFEAGRQERKEQEEALRASGEEEAVQKLAKIPVQSPVIDLNVFSELQDWTYAAQSFLDAGNPAALARLTDKKYPEFSAGILGFSKAILNCRGYNLVQTENIDALKSMVDQLGAESDLQEQLQPLLEKVGEKIQPFRSGTTRNGFAAVQWCIDHGMVQQGITFLQETVVSYVVEAVVGMQNLNNPVYRYAANGVLNQHESPDKTLQVHSADIRKLKMKEAEIRDFYQKMYEFVQSRREVSQMYKRLTGQDGFRNDINHCGFRENPLSPDDLKRNLEYVFSKIKRLLYVN